MKVINLFAGPGAGKSTIRAEVFSKLKRKDFKVEEVTEFAKDLTWEKNYDSLSDQLYITANQNRRQNRLVNQVDWCITDCPLLLGIHYVGVDYLPNTYKNLTLELFNTYENINFFITRTKKYSTVGRTQTEDEAIEIDRNIVLMLKKYDIPFIGIIGDSTASDTILGHLKC